MKCPFLLFCLWVKPSVLICVFTSVCLALHINVLRVSVCQLRESRSRLRTQVGAGQDFVMPPDYIHRDQRWFGTAHTLSLMLADVRKSLPVLIPYLQIVTCRMCWITYHDYLQGESAWAYRWKGISRKGYHVRKNIHIDYGPALFFRLFPLHLPRCHFGSRYV